MAYAIVQQKDGINNSATTVATGNFASNPTAGNLIYVAASGDSAATSFNTPTDTLGNTYVLIGSATESGTSAIISHWYAKNISGGGANSVTVTTTGTATIVAVYAVEISGLSTTSPLDVHAEQGAQVGASGANAMTSGSASNTQQPAVIIGFQRDLQGAVESAGTSPISFTGLTAVWNNLGGSGVNNGLCEHARLTTTGSVAATFQDTGFDRYLAVMAVFVEAGTQPTINSHPASQQVGEHQVATLAVTATASAGSLTYQWQDNRSGSFANVTYGTGATSATYYTPPFEVSQSGRQFKCVVTDSNGSVTSDAATITVVPFDKDPSRSLKRKRNGGMNMGLDPREWWG